jgi:carlactone synthase/all-trans-10'-apo-beta-carotenal 13,14-cleaving dioxygenase
LGFAPAPYYAFDWLPASGSYMHVVCRSTGNTVASVEVPPFMAIHYINAYEDDVDGAAVIVDCCEHYGDPAIYHPHASPPQTQIVLHQ